MKKSELRKIIREEIESSDLFANNGRLTPYLSMEQFEDKWKTDFFKKPINEMGNPLPPKDSNWFAFAEAFDVGILDLNSFAADMGFKTFRNLDKSITPKNLYSRDAKKFINKLRQASVMVSDSMSASEIQKKIKSLWP